MQAYNGYVKFFARNHNPKVLITDREQTAVVDIARRLVESNGLEMASRMGIRRMDYEEQCEEIREAYYEQIRWNPRVPWGGSAVEQGAFWLRGVKTRADDNFSKLQD